MKRTLEDKSHKDQGFRSFRLIHYNKQKNASLKRRLSQNELEEFLLHASLKQPPLLMRMKEKEERNEGRSGIASVACYAFKLQRECEFEVERLENVEEERRKRKPPDDVSCKTST